MTFDEAIVMDQANKDSDVASAYEPSIENEIEQGDQEALMKVKYNTHTHTKEKEGRRKKNRGRSFYLYISFL